MTGYRPEDLEGWEFKIVRSASGALKKPERRRAILNEEARAGWELIEKFDDNRIRLKRSTAHRQMDPSLDFDPYRTWVGMSPNALAGWVLLGVFGALALIGAGGAIVVRFAN